MALRLLITLALIVFCCSPTRSHAQFGPMGVEPTFDLIFPGGTVGDFYEYFKTNGYSKQIIITEEARAAKVPPLTVERVPTDSGFYDLLNEFAEDRGRFTIQRVTGHVLSLRLAQTSTSIVPRKKKVLGTVSLSNLLPKDSSQEKIDEQIEPILRALKTATEFINGDSDNNHIAIPAFRYHPETGLLFVMGTQKELNLANVILQKAVKPAGGYQLDIVSLSDTDSPAKANDKE